MNVVQFFVRVERYEPPINSILFKPHYELMAVSKDHADEQFGKYLCHLIDAYGTLLTIRRETYSVPNVDAFMKVITIVDKNKDVASISLIPVLIDSRVYVKELEQGDL